MDNSTVMEGFLGQQSITLPKAMRKNLGQNPMTRFFFMSDMGFYPKAGRHFRKRGKGAEEFIFIYCTDGEGWLVQDGEKMQVFPNQYFIVEKGVPHSYGANTENPWSIYWMHFDGDSAMALFERYDRHSHKIQDIGFDDGRIRLFYHILELLQTGGMESRTEYACLLGLQFVSSFIFNNMFMSVNSERERDLIDSIITFFAQNLEKPLKSKDIAREFNYSSSYFFHLFKKRTGYSPIHYFNLKKMQKACKLLIYTDLEVKEISLRLGFDDPLYFSRVFKKYMGISPKFYRQREV